LVDVLLNEQSLLQHELLGHEQMALLSVSELAMLVQHLVDEVD
jgi:hypothetical protein